MNEVARRDIRRLAEHALTVADVRGIFPTPLSVIRDGIGISELVDLSALPDDLKIKRPGILGRILGAFAFKTKTVFVDLSQSTGRARFTEGHEIGHELIPWHQAAHYLDGESNLRSDTRQLLEQEANFAASQLIFQGSRFFDRALEYERSIHTPLSIAGDFGASMHATLRYYVENHPDEVGLVLAGIYRIGGGLPIWDSIESPSFRLRYGPLRRAFGDELQLEDTPYSEAVGSAVSNAEVTECTVPLQDLNGNWSNFRAEAFCNRYCTFLMLSPHRILRTGRRVRLVASR